jgi:hypothetical protein
MVVNKTSSTLSNDGGINLLGLLTMTTGTFDADGAGSGVLTLVSDSNADGRIGSMAGGSIQGEVTFQRYYDNTTSNRWRNFGFPVGDVTYSELGSSIVLQPNSLARYNELASGNVDQGWIFVNSGTLSTQFGHTAWMYNTTPTTVSVRGPLVKQTNAPYNYLVTYFNDPAQPASEDGWNLVPNPYASPIDWDNPGWVKTNVNSVIAVWNNATGIYNYTTGGPNSLWDGVIAAGQSFWVQTNAINPVLTSSESVKVNVSDPEFYRKKNEPIRWLLAVGLKSLDNYDQTYIRFSTEATPEFDGSFDAYKLKNSIYNLSTLTNEGLNLAVNVLPKASCTSSIRLNITNAEPGSYTMNFEGLDSFENVNSVTLVDKMLDKKLVLNKETVYEFEITANSRTYGAERFELVFDFGDEVIQPQITQEEIQLVSSSDKGNQWYFNNEIVEGATGKYFTPSAPGNYHVVVSDGVCDLQSASLYVSEGYSRVYPNPATEVLKVDVRNALESNQQGEIRIHSLQGQLMHTEPFTSHDRVKEILVNQFAAGMYVLTITNENGVVIEKTKVIRK